MPSKPRHPGRPSARASLALFVVLGTLTVVGLLLLFLLRLPHRPAPPGHGPLVVYCAAGLRAPVEAIARRYEQAFGIPVQLSFGGSQTLLAGIELAPRGDLYLPADASYLALARQKGVIAESIPLARMTAVIVVPKGNPKGLRSVNDLLRPGLKLAQANPEAAAVGKLTREALAKAGAWEALRRQTVVFKPTVNDVANDVKLGTVDAGFIWDALVTQDPELEAVRVPELGAARAEVAVGVLRSSAQPAAALRFARYLGAPEAGQMEFARQGFERVEGDAWAETPEIVLYSGAMNRVAVEETLQRFEQREGVRVTRIYNGCGILVAQMKAGGRPDAYLTCDRSFLSPVAELFPGQPTEMSDSRIVMLAPKGNPRHLQALKDLARPGLRLGVANPDQSTLGALTRRLLEQEGILAPVMTNVVSQTPTADLLVTQMRAGSLDAVVVYVSNTVKVRSELDIISLPMSEALAVQTFSAAANSKHQRLVGRLLEALKTGESRARYEAAGFHWRGGELK